MSQYEYLTNGGRIRQSELEAVRHPTISKPSGKRIDIPGIGSMGISVSTGRVDKDRLELWTDGIILVVAATHDEIKKKIRRLRPEEAAQLDAIDAEFATLREKRAALLKEAWARGHTVTVKELVEKIPAQP